MNIFQKCCCAYCEKYQFPALWELSDGVLWFEIPKNGSSTMKTNHNITFWNERRPIRNLESYKNSVPCVIFRDPVDRFLSLFVHYFMETERRFGKGNAFCKRLDMNIKNMSVDIRLDFLINNLKELTTDEEVHHFYPQTCFIDTNHFDKFNVININDLSETFGFPTNTRTRKVVQLSGEQEQYIKQTYADDYNFFKQHGDKQCV